MHACVCARVRILVAQLLILFFIFIIIENGTALISPSSSGDLEQRLTQDGLEMQHVDSANTSPRA